ncbi:hypothetical protein GOP47_0024018 [Adiantum capillus-veneris]|uniref:SFR19-like C-terminal domain-containing protein n=1 Tax=Adiantum capillus-veneris TaxID=13818 RepID=A0A9D4U4V1_ADICA|nr:hypothetical protein GOP47_0024018 [Adiantum capillus-veneris]
MRNAGLILIEGEQDEAKPLSTSGAIEKKRLEANAGAVQKTEPALFDHSLCKPDCPPSQREKGDVKAPLSTAPPKRKAESIIEGSIMKKGMPHEDLCRLQSLSQEAKGDPHKRKPGIGEHAQKEEISKEDQRNSPGGGPSDEVRSTGDVGAVEATEKHSKEYHGLRLLKSALADYVKEILRPAWKEGIMSKEAFKSIVKKVVDKVIGSLQTHQIPKSQENVDQYMTQSQAKISKLVQGYVDRFKKN